MRYDVYLSVTSEDSEATVAGAIARAVATIPGASASVRMRPDWESVELPSAVRERLDVLDAAGESELDAAWVALMDLVYDCTGGDAAADVNNGGIERQIGFLLAEGLEAAQILDALASED